MVKCHPTHRSGKRAGEGMYGRSGSDNLRSSMLLAEGSDTACRSCFARPEQWGGGGAEMSSITAYMQRSGNSGRESSFDKSGSYILGSVYLQIRLHCQRGQWHQKQALFEVFERVTTPVLPSEMKWSQSTSSSDSPIAVHPQL